MTEHADLQSAITTLQIKHGELVEAVRGHSSVAATTNERVKAGATANKKIAGQVSTLKAAVGGDQRGSLWLDFANDLYQVGESEGTLRGKKFSDIITFSRGSGGGRFGPDGKYEWLGAGVPRINYDPMTGECRGLLVEEQRTNLLTHSSGFVETTWGKAACSVVVSPTSAPDGSSTAHKLVPNNGAALNLVEATMGKYGISSGSYSFSIHAKAAGCDRVRIRIMDSVSYHMAHTVVSLVDGTFVIPPTATGTFSAVTGTVSNLGNGWFRVTITGTPNTANALAVQVFPYSSTMTTGDGTSGIFLWGAQLEKGSFPTSYIPTTTAQVTRSADVANVNVLSPWYRTDEGTLFADTVRFGNNTCGIFNIWDGTTNNRIGFVGQTTSVANKVDYGGVVQTAVSTVTGGTDSGKVAMAYALDDIAGCKDGGVIVTDSSATIPTVTSAILGRSSGPSAHLNGHIRSIRYFPSRLPDSELQALTNG